MKQIKYISFVNFYLYSAIVKVYEYLLYVHMSLIFPPHFASLRKFKRGHQTFCGEPLFTHTHTYTTLFTLAPRVSGIANSHELQTRDGKRAKHWYITPIF